MLGVGLALTSLPALGLGEVSGAALMLAAESQGLAFSFTDDFFHASTGHYGSARVKDTSTPANNYDSHPFGLLTYSGASPKLCCGPDGNLRYGAHNLFKYSEDLSNSAWSGAGREATVTPNAAVAPDGTKTAVHIGELSGSGTHGRAQNVPIIGPLPHRYYFYAKAAERTFVRAWSFFGGSGGTGHSYWDLSNGTVDSGDGADATIEAVGNGWFLCSALCRQAEGGSDNYIHIGPLPGDLSGVGSYDGIEGYGIYIWHPSLRRIPSDPTYLKTTDAAVYELPYEWDKNGDLLGIRVEPTQVTNLALWSNDFTNSVWTKTNLTAAKTATGPDGVANSASTLTATDANATALQAITSSEAERITFCWIKRRTGTGDIELTQDNGSTWTKVTVAADWTQVEIEAATLANPTVGIRIVTSGDAVDVSLFNHHVAGAVSSPIETAGSTVTRAADTLGPALSKFPWNSGNGDYEVDGQAETPTNNGTILTLAPRSGETHIQTVKWVPSS